MTEKQKQKRSSDLIMFYSIIRPHYVSATVGIRASSIGGLLCISINDDISRLRSLSLSVPQEVGGN